MRKELTDERTARAKVLDAALLAAAEAAPGPVRVADIAARAGMSPGHVMYYFKRRDRIVVETLLYAEQDLARRRDHRLARSVDPHQALRMLVSLYLPTSRSDPRWRLWTQLLASPPVDRATRDAFAQITDSWSSSLAAVIQRGCREGSMTCTDPPSTAYRLCRLMDGYALEVLLGTPGRGSRWAVRAVLDTASEIAPGLSAQAS